jgi:IS5 family transposase
LQTLHGLSDREAAEAVTFDLRWKAACGVAVDAGAFHPSTLTYWRRRLAGSERPNRIFEAVRQVIVETGAVAAGHGGRWTPRSLMTRSPGRTPSPS